MDRTTTHAQATVATNGASPSLSSAISAMGDRAVSNPTGDEPVGAVVNANRLRISVTELIAQLMWQPKTAAELSEATGLRINTVYLWLPVLKAGGVVYVYEKRYTRFNRPIEVWALQPKPFAMEDAK